MPDNIDAKQLLCHYLCDYLLYGQFILRAACPVSRASDFSNQSQQSLPIVRVLL